jgi:uncharacterized protein involved in type VI secretion and phage assembly
MDEFFGEPQPDAELAYIPGAVVGIVTNNSDPGGMGRIKVRLPHLGEADESNWARIAVPMAGKEQGIYFLPEVGDEVLVVFEHANPRFPFILGALWNGKEPPPAKNDDGNNDVRIIKSRSGHVIRFTDNEESGAKIEIIDGSGKNSLVFDTAAKLIKIESDQDITLSAANGTIKLDARTIEIVSSDAAKVEASSRLDVKASGAMTLKAATIDLN